MYPTLMQRYWVPDAGYYISPIHIQNMIPGEHILTCSSTVEGLATYFTRVRQSARVYILVEREVLLHPETFTTVRARVALQQVLLVIGGVRLSRCTHAHL